MLHWGKYLIHALRGRRPGDRLVMNILCKDEADIIEPMIRTHAALGVDAFAVMDNRSTDGTRERLEALAGEFELAIVDQPSPNYQQSRWMSQLARFSRARLGPRWIINSDADEFWLPAAGSLKDCLAASDSVVQVPRSNMILTEAAMADSYRFDQAAYRVQAPLLYDKATQHDAEQISMLLVRTKPKVIVNPDGLLKMKGGNHCAWHIAAPFTAREEKRIRIYHYPIRSWRQFEAKIRHRQYLLRTEHSRMGHHYQRWVALLEADRLEEEFRRMVLPAPALEVFEHYGVICRDPFPGEVLRRCAGL